MTYPGYVEVTAISENEGEPWIHLREEDYKMIHVGSFNPVIRKLDNGLKQAAVNKVWLHAMKFEEGRWDAVNGFVFNDRTRKELI